VFDGREKNERGNYVEPDGLFNELLLVKMAFLKLVIRIPKYLGSKISKQIKETSKENNLARSGGVSLFIAEGRHVLVDEVIDLGDQGLRVL